MNLARRAAGAPRLARRAGRAWLLAALVLAGCASASAPPIEDPPLPRAPAGVPGFDTRAYPGDAAMAQWRVHSPYRWVGFYLPAPCFTETSWIGRRDDLEAMGWGTAVLFVGEQDWAPGSAPPPEDVPASCTRTNLTPERGRTDGRAAADAAAAEGFPAGTAIFLDVERVASVSPELAAYVAAWTAAVVADGRYEPALYAHARNARDLRDVMDAAMPGRPRLWVATSDGFGLLEPPSASGFDDATVWQGAFDVEETWGEATLRIDRNVADRRDPSG